VSAAATGVGWRDVVELVRAPAALSVPGDVLAGATAAGTLGPRTAALAAASVCLYWAGMAANDWADRELDARERPERPIPSGTNSSRRADVSSTVIDPTRGWSAPASAPGPPATSSARSSGPGSHHSRKPVQSRAAAIAA